MKGGVLEHQSKMEWKTPELQVSQTDNTKHINRAVENCEGHTQPETIPIDSSKALTW